MRNLLALALLGVALGAGYVVYQGSQSKSPCPGPNCPLAPPPAPPPTPPPPKKPSPWGPRGVRSVDLRDTLLSRPRPRPSGMTLGGPIGPGGIEVQTDLPSRMLKANIALQGAGCCVFRSIEYCALYQHEPDLYDLPEQMGKAGMAGGGWPAKVDEVMKKFAPSVGYLQYEGNDPSVLELALKTDRMVGVTYNGHDPHYSGSIAHMLCLVYLDDKTACVRDNNFVGEDELVWMPRQDFLTRWKGGDRNGWAVILTHCGPAPIPLPHK